MKFVVFSHCCVIIKLLYFVINEHRNMKISNHYLQFTVQYDNFVKGLNNLYIKYPTSNILLFNCERGNTSNININITEYKKLNYFHI